MINEVPPHPTAQMTPEQRRQAEAAILGLPADNGEPKTFTPEQIEFMRTAVAQADSHIRTREFDLNNPPRKPYRHLEYPKMLYHHADRVSKVVRSREQEDGMLELGYVHEPFANAAVDALPVLDAATQAEIARLDAIARQPRKPR